MDDKATKLAKAPTRYDPAVANAKIRMNTGPLSVQIVPLIDKVSSGPSLSVPTLCQALVDAGIPTKLMALDPKPDRLLFPETTFYPYPSLPFSRPLGVSRSMKRALGQAAKTADIMHTHSLWKMPNIYPEAARRGTNCKLLVSPRGTLSDWARNRSKLRKWIIWNIGQKRLLMNVDCVHATCMEELHEVRRVRPSGPVAVVPNGVHCPDASSLTKSQNRDRRVVLFLARIHPKKGIDILLEAWKNLGPATNDWDLQIAGPKDHAFANEMMALRDALGLENVVFIGEVLGAAKSRTFVNADLYVLPTHSENFGISVAEALAHSVPAIVFEGAPWSGLNEKDAGWWLPHSVEGLTETLRTALSASDERRAEMGRNGRRWVEQEFDWNVVGRRMAAVYRWLVHGGPRPVDVVVD